AEAQAHLRERRRRVRHRRLGANPDPADTARVRFAAKRSALGRLRKIRRALGQGGVAPALRYDRRRAARHLEPARGARAMNDLQLGLPGIAAEHVEWVWSDDDEDTQVREFSHATVMRDEVVEALAPHP